MFTDNLDLVFATVSVTANSKPIVFEVKKNSLDSYWLDNGTEVHPAGCIDIIVNILPYQVGDVLCVEFDHGVLTCDGGGENLLNIVGEIGEYTVAMGAPYNDDDNEDTYNKNWPEDMHPTKYLLPYENRGFTSRGFEFCIVDAPKEYFDRFYRTNIVITVVWEYSSKDYAWRIVSFLTS